MVLLVPSFDCYEIGSMCLLFLPAHLLITMKLKKWFSLFLPLIAMKLVLCVSFSSLFCLSPFPPCSACFLLLFAMKIEKWIPIVSLCPLFVLMTPLTSYCCYGFPLSSLFLFVLIVSPCSFFLTLQTLYLTVWICIYHF